MTCVLVSRSFRFGSRRILQFGFGPYRSFVFVRHPPEGLERVKGIEPSSSGLEGCCSTIELHPPEFDFLLSTLVFDASPVRTVLT